MIDFLINYGIAAVTTLGALLMCAGACGSNLGEHNPPRRLPERSGAKSRYPVKRRAVDLI
jgi:hypothetical protein